MKGYIEFSDKATNLGFGSESKQATWLFHYLVGLLFSVCIIFRANDASLYVYDRGSNQRTLRVSGKKTKGKKEKSCSPLNGL